jgi:hypothetical protein
MHVWSDVLTTDCDFGMTCPGFSQLSREITMKKMKKGKKKMKKGKKKMKR